MKNTTHFKDFEASHSGRMAFGRLRTHRTDLVKMFITILQTVSANIDGLIPGQKYKASELCGGDAWSEWHFQGQRVAAGMCLSFLVRAGALQLVLHKTKSGSGSKRYFVPIKA
jgi:hypothetical protein